MLATLVTFQRPTREDCRSCADAGEANVRATLPDSVMTDLRVATYLGHRDINSTLVYKHGRAISGRKWAGLITGSKGGMVCALA